MSRVYFYSHDGQGLGHFRRNLNIAAALSRKARDVSCLLITGSQFPGLFRLPARCDFVKVPTVRKCQTGAYLPIAPRELLRDVLHARSEIIKATVRAMPPDVLIVDRHAAGMEGELLPALMWIRKHAPACRVVLGLRDVLDEPGVVEREWQDQMFGPLVSRFYHRVWIYGDPTVFSATDTYDFPPEVLRKTHYTGYLLPRDKPQLQREHAELRVVASVGGGADGFSILENTIRALKQLQHNMPVKADVFAGPLMSKSDFLSLVAMANSHEASIRVQRFGRDLLRTIDAADVVIMMGGYNTVVETVSRGKPAVVVPRTFPRKEQLIRARAFEAMGLVSVLEPDRLSPAAIADAITSLHSRRTSVDPTAIKFDGASDVLRHIRHILRTGTVSDV